MKVLFYFQFLSAGEYIFWRGKILFSSVRPLSIQANDNRVYPNPNSSAQRMMERTGVRNDLTWPRSLLLHNRILSRWSGQVRSGHHSIEQVMNIICMNIVSNYCMNEWFFFNLTLFNKSCRSLSSKLGSPLMCSNELTVTYPKPGPALRVLPDGREGKDRRPSRAVHSIEVVMSSSLFMSLLIIA